MAKYVLAYRGGGMPETEAEQQAEMARWGEWYGALGAAVVDGGNPFAASATVAADGTSSQPGSAGLTGYTIVTADSLAGATEHAKGCPILRSGGSVDVYEAIEMG